MVDAIAGEQAIANVEHLLWLVVVVVGVKNPKPLKASA